MNITISPTIQKILIACGAFLVVLASAYNIYIQEPVTNSEVIADEVVGEDILFLVEKLKRVSIDKTVFSSNIFNSLVDFNINLLSEPQGRPNPFSKIGSDSTTASSKSKTGL